MAHTHPERAYLNLLERVLNTGKVREDRTCTGTISRFGDQIRFDIRESVPLLTTKFVAWKAVIKELLWFLSGNTNSKALSNQGVRIWDANTTREFLDRRGLTHLPEGDIGAGYGFQWRHFGADYKTCNDKYTGQGADQVQYVLDELKNNPYSRRIFMSAWNPIAMSSMALPPCHVSCQFYVEDDVESGQKLLSCHMYQRSVDCFLGLPFNILSYTVLTYILAAKTGMVPGELIISTGDTHIYKNHVDQVNEQLSREPHPFPTLSLSESVKTKDFAEMTIDDFQIQDYQYHPAIRAPMSA